MDEQASISSVGALSRPNVRRFTEIAEEPKNGPKGGTLKPSAATVKLQRALDELAAEIAELRGQVTLTLGLVAAIAEAVSPTIAEASAGAEAKIRTRLGTATAPAPDPTSPNIGAPEVLEPPAIPASPDQKQPQKPRTKGN